MMNDIGLLFGRPAIQDRQELLSLLRDLQAKHGCMIQVLDADKVVSEKHLVFAAKKAFLAFSERRNIAKDLGVEIMRYASGERQIERALTMGISNSTKRIVLIVVPLGDGRKLPTATDLSSLIELDERGCSFNSKAVRDFFDISPEEIRAVGEQRIPDLVLERVALVDTYH